MTECSNANILETMLKMSENVDGGAQNQAFRQRPTKNQIDTPKKSEIETENFSQENQRKGFLPGDETINFENFCEKLGRAIQNKRTRHTE